MTVIFSVGSAITNRMLKTSSIITVIQNTICTSPCLLITKHWNQKFRKLRAKKVMKIDLPDYETTKKSFMDVSQEEARSMMKEKGVAPLSGWNERPFYVSTTSQIIEPYVPPEGDGKMSLVSKEGAKQKIEFVGKKGKSMLALRKLRKFDDDFEVKDFLLTAQDVYVRAHNAMMNIRKDKDELLLYVTEKAYPEMLHNAIDKTIHWKMIGLLEEPRLVQARATSMISDDNVFCQLTVRFHTQQMLALYDRFGRLMYGSEILAKDVLEYIVFERHLANKYGTWRIHAKIIPDWMPPKDPVPKTFRILEEKVINEEPEQPKEVKPSPIPSDTPPVAMA